ncbi:UMP-CMP kinase [Hordeum vulgare]|nr:UMP-CMP kinase [Hordeum vulgare]
MQNPQLCLQKIAKLLQKDGITWGMDNVIHELGDCYTGELVVRAYDAKAVEYHKEDATLNFLDCREYTKFLAPENIRICTKDEENENLQTKQQLFDLVVSELSRDDKLVETNKMMLLEYVAGKSTKEYPIVYVKLATKEEEVQLLQHHRRSARDDHEVGPCGQ